MTQDSWSSFYNSCCFCIDLRSGALLISSISLVMMLWDVISSKLDNPLGITVIVYNLIGCIILLFGAKAIMYNNLPYIRAFVGWYIFNAIIMMVFEGIRSQGIYEYAYNMCQEAKTQERLITDCSKYAKSYYNTRIAMIIMTGIVLAYFCFVMIRFAMNPSVDEPRSTESSIVNVNHQSINMEPLPLYSPPSPTPKSEPLQPPPSYTETIAASASSSTLTPIRYGDESARESRSTLIV